MEQCPASTVKEALQDEVKLQVQPQPRSIQTLEGAVEENPDRICSLTTFLPIQLVTHVDNLSTLASGWPLKVFFGQNIRVHIPREAVTSDRELRTIVFDLPQLLMSATETSLTLGFRAVDTMLQPVVVIPPFSYQVTAQVESGMNIPMEPRPMSHREKEDLDAQEPSSSTKDLEN